MLLSRTRRPALWPSKVSGPGGASCLPARRPSSARRADRPPRSPPAGSCGSHLLLASDNVAQVGATLRVDAPPSSRQRAAHAARRRPRAHRRPLDAPGRRGAARRREALQRAAGAARRHRAERAQRPAEAARRAGAHRLPAVLGAAAALRLRADGARPRARRRAAAAGRLGRARAPGRPSRCATRPAAVRWRPAGGARRARPSSTIPPTTRSCTSDRRVAIRPGGSAGDPRSPARKPQPPKPGGAADGCGACGAGRRLRGGRRGGAAGGGADSATVATPGSG